MFALDARLLFGARIVHLFAYGFVAVVLFLYLSAIGLDDHRIGLLLSLTLAGDVLVSLYLFLRRRASRRAFPRSRLRASPNARPTAYDGVTHLPSNILLILIPLMPNLLLAITVLLLRSSISQMDVPTRQAFVIAAVDPTERTAAAGITGVARTTGAALVPVIACR